MAYGKKISKYDVEISSPIMDCRVFWARTVSSENQSLLTQYTKHTFYEIQYALEGHIGMNVGDDRLIYIAESDFMVIPPDTYHQVVDAESSGARFIMAFSVEPKSDTVSAKLKQLCSLEPKKQTPLMPALLALIAENEERYGALKERTAVNLLDAFLLEILGTCSSSKMIPDTLEERDSLNQVRQAIELIKKRNGIDVKVSQLAKEMNMSERHLRRLFEAELKISPKEAIDYERLKKIEEYMTHTGLSLQEISELCGFCDEYAMNKFFKKHTKITPSDFLKLAKSKNKK